MKLKGPKGELITVPDGMEEAAFEAQANGKLAEFADSLKERVEAKKGGMLKRKDGSYSRRGLWDNIRANRGSGRKPTKEMLRQEKKIRAKAGDGMLVGDQEPQENFGPVKKKTYTPSQETLFQKYFRIYPERPETDSLLEHTSPGSALAGYIGTTICGEGGCRPYVAPNPSEERRMELYREAWQEKYRQGFDPSTRSRNPYDKRLLELFPPDPNKPSGKVLGPNGEVLRDYGPPSPNMDYFSPDFIHWWNEVDEKGNKIRPKQAAGGTVFKGYVTEQPMGDAVPWHTSTIGESETYGKGGYTVKRSSARKGKTHVVIGPDGTKKYFGDSKLGQHPGNPKRKKSFYARHAKNLKKNPYFRAFARATWADGGEIDGEYPVRTTMTEMSSQQDGNFNNLTEAYTATPDMMSYERQSGPEFTGFYSSPERSEIQSRGPAGESVRVLNPSSPEDYLMGQALSNRVNTRAGKKLGGNIYNLGLMPYRYGGSTINPATGLIEVPRGYGEMASNERDRDLYKKGGFLSKAGDFFADAGKSVADTVLSTVGGVTNIDALKDVVKDKHYKTAAFDKASNVAGGLGDIISTAAKFVPGVNVIAGAAGGVGALVDKAAGIDKRYYDPREHQSGFEKTAGTIRQIGDFASMFTGNPSSILGKGIQLGAKTSNIVSGIGKVASLGNMAYGLGESFKSGNVNPMQLLQLGLGANSIAKGGFFSGANNVNPNAGNSTAGMGGGSPYGTKRYGGYTHMANGGQTGLVPINVEGADFSEGSGPDAKKGELLVINGRIIKNYVGRPPHPAEGQNPLGNDDAPEGLIVIPKNRTKEYLEAGLSKRKQMERSLVSQQQDREMKKSRKMGDGGYYSFGMGEMGMAYGGPINNPETIRSMMEWGGPDAYKKGGWIQKVTKSIKRRGTEGVCTGSKFGSSSCPPGSRRYNLAKTFRKMARSRHEFGGRAMAENGVVTKLTPEQENAANQAFARLENYEWRGQGNPEAQSAYQQQLVNFFADPQYDIAHKVDSLNKVYPKVFVNDPHSSTSSEVNWKKVYNPNDPKTANRVYQKRSISGIDPKALQQRAATEKDTTYEYSGTQQLKLPQNQPNPYFINPSYIKQKYGGFVDPVTGSHTVMYGEGGKLPAGILRSRMEASGKSDAAIQNYMSRYYKKEGGPTIHDFPTMRMRYDINSVVTLPPYADEYVPDVMSPRQQAISDYITSGQYISGANASADNSVIGNSYPINMRNLNPSYNPRMARISAPTLPGFERFNPAQANSGYELPFGPVATPNPFTAAQPAAPGLQPTPAQAAMMGRINAGEPITATTYKPTYQIPTVELDLNQRTSSPYMDEGMNAQGEYYDQTTGTAGPNSESNMAKQARIQNINRAAALQDLAGLAPTLYNLGRYAFEKPDLMKYDEYMTPEMKFRATKFDETPYREATSRALYNSNMGLAARTALASGMAQGRSAGYMDWLNKEALRRQGVDEANLGIDARNKAMKYQIALQNMASKARRKDFLGTATEQFAQTFGRDPRYFAAIAGDKSAYRTPFSGWFDSGANTTTNTTTGSTTSTASSPMFNAANRRYMAGVDRDLAAQFPNIYKTGR